MTDAPKTAASVIKEAIWSVCTDGNSDPNRVARDVILALDAAGFVVAPREPTEAMTHAARDWSYAKYGKPIGKDASDGCWQAMNGVCK